MLLLVALLLAAPERPVATLADTLYDYARLTDTDTAEVREAFRDLRSADAPAAPLDFARAVGLSLRELTGTLEEFVAVTPVIVELREPSAHAVLTGADAEWVQWIDGPGTFLGVVPREAAEARLTGRGYALAEPPAGGPRCVIEHAHQPLGRGYLGVQLGHRFVIRNTGAEPLKINTRSASCSCTKPTQDELIIAPGEAGELPIELRVPHLGDVLEYVWLFTNDPRRPLLPVTLAAEGLFGVTCYPTQIRLAASLAGGEETAVRVLAPNTLALTEVLVEPAVAEARIERRSEELEFVEYLIVLKATPGAAGTLTAALVLKTDHPDFAELRLPVHLRRR